MIGFERRHRTRTVGGGKVRILRQQHPDWYCRLFQNRHESFHVMLGMKEYIIHQFVEQGDTGPILLLLIVAGHIFDVVVNVVGGH